MSWEDCGYKPGKIDGPAKCTRRCGDCDGEHHFIVTTDSGNGEEPDTYFACKHCGATAKMVDEEDDGGDEGGPSSDDLDPANHCTCGGVRGGGPCDVTCPLWSPTENYGPLFDGLGDDMGPVVRGTSWGDGD